MNNLQVISLGMVNVFLLKGNKYILVDTGLKGSAKKIVKAMNKLSINPKDIELIILTHNHEDHIGALNELVELTGAKTLIHQLEYDCMRCLIDDDIKPLVLLSKIMLKLSPLEKIPVSKEFDILVTDEYDLSEYGLNAKVIHTPGHTKGSISILIDDKVIIGDSLMAMMPWSKPGKPILAYDTELIKESMQRLIDLGAKEFFFSHGKSYDAKIIQNCFKTF